MAACLGQRCQLPTPSFARRARPCRKGRCNPPRCGTQAAAPSAAPRARTYGQRTPPIGGCSCP
eukprot:11559582-Alexandrium_andersonii.AAC.1